MPEDNSSQNNPALINERLDYLEQSLSEQIARLYAIEQKLGLAVPPQPAQAPPPPSPPPEPQQEFPRYRAETVPEIKPTIVEKISAEAIKPKRDYETIIGGTWFNRIGILAIILGVGYFLREAFRRGWIGPHGRVAIGIAIGIGLMVGGERMRRRGYRSYAQGLSGGGIAILYLSFYAAFERYGLIGQPPAFALMSMVTIVAVLLAARYDALAIAILGLIGGFLTPILLSTGVDKQVALFSYIILLDLGVLALAYFKQWRTLNYLAFIATLFMCGSWLSAWYAPEKLWTTIFFFTAFFLIFSALTIFHNLAERHPARMFDTALIFANPLIYFVICHSLLETKYRPFMGLFAASMSAFHLGLGYLIYKSSHEERRLLTIFQSVAIIFLILAIPIQFDQHWATIAWAVVAAAFVRVGLRNNNRLIRYAAGAIFIIAIIHWLMIDFAEFGLNYDGKFIPFFNRRALSGLALIASLIVASRLYRRFGGVADKTEREFFQTALTSAANGLGLIWLSADIRDYFDQKIVAARGDLEVFSVNPLVERLANYREFSISALWTAYGLIAVLTSRLRRSALLRFGGLMLLAITTLKVVFVDSEYYAASWHRLIVNPTFGSYALLVAALACALIFYLRSEGIEETERSLAIPALTIWINLFAIIGLSVEAVGFFQSPGELDLERIRELALARRLSLSVVWAVYGGAMLAVGIWRSNRLLRFMALGLLALTIGKVFLVDLASLDKIYRIISFIVLGAILLIVSFLYQRWQRRGEEQIAKGPK